MPKRSSPICCRLSFATLLLLLMTQPAMTQESKSVTLELDHVSVCGSNGVTQMAIIGFDDASYVELIAPIKPGVTAGSGWAKFMAEDVVTCAWAVGTNVLLQEVDRLKKAGIPVKPPERGSRKRPDGMSVAGRPDDVGSGTPGSVLPFIIEDQ